MKKADYKFYRQKKQEIQRNARENNKVFYRIDSNPIFIPKRKKKK